MCVFLCLSNVIIKCWLVPPQIVGDEPLYKSVIVGESVELPCNATGTPKPRVIWQKGTRMLATGSTGLLPLCSPVLW